jgi:hypothetical protein
MFQLRHDVPSAWPQLVADFLRSVTAIPQPLPPGALSLLLADLARELDRLASQNSTTHGRPALLRRMELSLATDLAADTLCSRFEEAVTEWCAQLEPETLTSEVQALRVANYIDRHFA